MTGQCLTGHSRNAVPPSRQLHAHREFSLGRRLLHPASACIALAIPLRSRQQRLVVVLNLWVNREDRRRDRRHRIDVAFGFLGRHGDDLAAVRLPSAYLPTPSTVSTAFMTSV